MIGGQPLQRESSSFRDPSSGVVWAGRRVLRYLDADAAETFGALEAAGVLDDLVRRGAVIGWQTVSADEARAVSALAPRAALVVEHPTLPFISYPYEWSWSRQHLRKPLGTRVVELLFGRGAIWLAGIIAGVAILVVAITLGTTAGALVAVPFVLAALAVLRVKERIWIVGRRILVRRERISRRQMLAMMISISVIAGLTTGLGWIVGASIRRSYEEQLRRRFRAAPK